MDSNLFELGARLQRPETRRVGRGDVDDDEVACSRKIVDTDFIIGSRVRAVAILAEVDAERHTTGTDFMLVFDARADRADAVVVEAVAIDDGAILVEAKHARLLVARLRQRRHGANFHKADAALLEAGDRLAALVEAGRNT